jgi:hypothetical protein
LFIAPMSIEGAIYRACEGARFVQGRTIGCLVSNVNGISIGAGACASAPSRPKPASVRDATRLVNHILRVSPIGCVCVGYRHSACWQPQRSSVILPASLQ